MKLLSALLAGLVLSALGASDAHALPNLVNPSYAYAYQAPPSAAFDTRYINGQPAGFTRSRLEYYLFEPRWNNGSAVSEAPVVFFFHGATFAPDPKLLRKQIEHYVRSGFTVVYPSMCVFPCLDYDKQEDAAIGAIGQALLQLGGTGRVKPSRDAEDNPEYVFVAHSLGTIMAARIASLLGLFDSQYMEFHAPKALIFHDPAGHAVSIGGIVIKDILPIEPANLQHIRPDTLQVIYAQPLSPSNANGYDTVSRLHKNSPAQNKLAWVVPHQCVKSTNGSLSYACPGSLATATAENIKNLESHTSSQHVYVSHHDSGAADTFLNAMSRVGIIDHTTACARQATGSGVTDFCTGAKQKYTGVWREGTVNVRNADALVPYPFTP